MNQDQDGPILRRESFEHPFQDLHRLSFLYLIAELVVRLSSQHLINPAMMLIGQGADGDFVPFLCSPEIVTGSNGNTRKPMIEGDRLRKMRQAEVRSDEDIVDNFFDLIGRYPSAYDADDMGLIPAD